MTNRTIKNLYPSDWIEYKFDDLFEFEGGMSLSRAKLSDEGICYLHYGDIHKSNVNYIDVDNKLEEIPKYNTTLDNIKDKYLLRNGDIVFADASEDYESIGKSIVVINKSNTPFISGLHTITAKDKTDLLDNTYKRYFLLDWNIRKQIMVLSTGISVLGINKGNLKTVRVLLPPLKEQSKIGRILSTWDKAIELKERLIELKKEQKKGLMQKLLTGEVRVPGFNREWKSIKLKEIFLVRNERSVITEDLPLYSLTIEAGVTEKTDRYNREFLVKSDNKKYKLSRKDDIVYNPSNLRFGAIALNKTQNPVLLSPIYEVLYIKDNKKWDINFIAQLVTSDRQIRLFSAKAEGTLVERMAVKLDAFLNTTIYVPIEISEQRRIAEILGSLDKEIFLIKQELDSLVNQKKGLMQLLLTGKVRVQV